jgi:hypothetical protein
MYKSINRIFNSDLWTLSIMCNITTDILCSTVCDFKFTDKSGVKYKGSYVLKLLESLNGLDLDSIMNALEFKEPDVFYEPNLIVLKWNDVVNYCNKKKGLCINLDRVMEIETKLDDAGTKDYIYKLESKLAAANRALLVFISSDGIKKPNAIKDLCACGIDVLTLPVVNEVMYNTFVNIFPFARVNIIQSTEYDYVRELLKLGYNMTYHPDSNIEKSGLMIYAKNQSRMMHIDESQESFKYVINMIKINSGLAPKTRDTILKLFVDRNEELKNKTLPNANPETLIPHLKEMLGLERTIVFLEKLF